MAAFGIIPAHAGSTLPPKRVRVEQTDHPRSRGEHPSSLVWCPRRVGSSPLTRGAPVVRHPHPGGDGIIPAHAGSTPPPWSLTGSTRDHPRSRGEHRLGWRPGDRVTGSSPLTRGARRRLPWTGNRTVDHPRSRGEHGYRRARIRSTSGSSPLTRGAPHDGGVPRSQARIIPAHAGSTGWSRPSLVAARDHPRSRGEHVVLLHLE